jgi:hypothetical protein
VTLLLGLLQGYSLADERNESVRTVAPAFEGVRR